MESCGASRRPRPGSPEVPVALITGITGQDGSYLAELLLDKGYEVHGARAPIQFHRSGRRHRPATARRGPAAEPALRRPRRATRTGSIVGESGPDEVYHLAAQSHVQVSFDIPDYTG